VRTIIAGSRTITDGQLVAAAVAASGFHISEVVSGCARGADRLGEEWATVRGVPVRRFPAEWERHGRAAGRIRNAQMIADAIAAPQGGCVIAVWDGRSPGTRHTIELALQRGLAVYVFVPGYTDRQGA